MIVLFFFAGAGEGSVQAAQRRQVKARTVKRSAANYTWLPLRGEAKVGVVPRGSPSKQVLPRIQKLSPLCTLSLSVTAPGLPVLRGVSGGGAALSSLCRRFPGGDIMNLISRRSPLSGLSFSLFFFLRERKRGYQRRRSHKISVTKVKPDNPPNNNVQSLPH